MRSKDKIKVDKIKDKIKGQDKGVKYRFFRKQAVVPCPAICFVVFHAYALGL